jgi:UDP-GlcNAc:undecaprenyl-phosphate/decaprenyl-phosphate GlcNAc-1-phosphate transferase
VSEAGLPLAPTAADAMKSILLMFSVAFFLSLALTPLIRDLALGRGWLDRPDGRRKTHRMAVPRLGGIAVHLAFALSFGAALTVFRDAPWMGPPVPGAYLHLLAACTAVMLVGLLDDLFGVHPISKILVQAAAGLYLYYNGYQIRLVSNPFGETLNLGLLSLPITLLWFAGMSNAFNLIDGLDGLAAGVGLFSTSIVFILALMNDRWEIVLLSVVLAGALLGFLRYNFGSASIFLGDSGSLFVGFALAALAVRGSMKSSTAVAVLAPLLALGFPIVDTSMALLRRLVGRRGLLEPDADHIHHRIVRLGLTQQRAVVILYGVTALFGALSLLTMTGQSHAIGLAAVVFTLVTWIGIRRLGYSELGEIPRMLKRGLSFEWPPSANGSPLAAVPRAFREARDAEHLHEALVSAVSALRFERMAVRLRVPGPYLPVWEAPDSDLDPRRSWAWTIPLVNGKELLGEVELVGSLGRISSSVKAAELVEVLAVDFAAALARVLAAAEAPVVPAVRPLVAGADSNPSG